jgi:hypothetical protein
MDGFKRTMRRVLALSVLGIALGVTGLLVAPVVSKAAVMKIGSSAPLQLESTGR